MMEQEYIFDALHNERVENSILADLMSIDGHLKYSKCSEVISDKMFYNSTNRAVYVIIKEKYETDADCNISTVAIELQKRNKGINAIKCVTDINYNADLNIHLIDYAHMLAELYKRRRNYEFAMTLKDKINELDTEEQAEYIREHLEDIGKVTIKASVKSQTDALVGLQERVDNNLKGINCNIISTGFPDIDNRGGYQLGELNLIGADTGRGKTALALRIAYNIASNNIPIAYYSLEMGCVDLTARMISFGSGLALQKIRNRPLTKEELNKFDVEVGNQWNLPIYYDDANKSTFEDICSSIRYLQRTKGIKVAFVDYLQQLIQTNKSKNDTEANILATMARKLKDLAMSLNIVIVALVQFNQAEEDELPTLRRILGSVQIGQASDNIHLIHRIKNYSHKYPSPFENVDVSNTAMVLCKKGRNTGEYNFVCGFNGECTDFYPLEKMPTISRSNTTPEEDSNTYDMPW